MVSRRIDVHRAVERGDLAVLTRYLDAGGDVEKKDTEYGAAPIHWATLVRFHYQNDAVSIGFWTLKCFFVFILIVPSCCWDRQISGDAAATAVGTLSARDA